MQPYCTNCTHVCTGSLPLLTCGCFSFLPGTLITVLEKLLSQKTESEHAGCLVICAALNNAAKVRELLQKYPDKASFEDILSGCFLLLLFKILS